MKSIYPISDTLSQAIENLFPDPSGAHWTLGVGRDVADDWLDVPDVAGMQFLDRAAHLRNKLENYVISMAKESVEMGSPESTEALRMQAVGLFIALRELMLHFPELNK
jgi:hypothetical protein